MSARSCITVSYETVESCYVTFPYIEVFYMNSKGQYRTADFSTGESPYGKYMDFDVRWLCTIMSLYVNGFCNIRKPYILQERESAV